MKPYQFDYTSQSSVASSNMYNIEARTRKAMKIIKVLEDYYGDTSPLNLLDMSCSTGIMTQVFGHHFSHVIGIDIDHNAISYAQSVVHENNISFLEMDALDTGFPKKSFHVIICNQMYEHVPDPSRLLEEIYRILIPGGVCYFGATNRLKLIETHYGKLPFLSWLPRKCAHVYLRLLGKGSFYYESLMTFWALRELVVMFQVIDYTKNVLNDPKRFYCDESVPPGSFRQKLGLVILDKAYWLSPGYVWLLKKPVDV